ncbi:MAG: hypothetical protein PHO02_02845 [Candidatus Nanoarchaeia archaeon]|nr:hypothetical protein [Candidatus Nanoarchaeia archaeon]
MQTAIQEITPKENEVVELQPPSLQEPQVFFSFLLEDTLPLKKESPLISKEALLKIIEENNTGIENKIKGDVLQEDDEEEYAKETTYETENSYIQKNPYAPTKDYERIDFLKPKEKEEEKSFLWK